MAPSGSGGPIYELIASLGLDTSDLERGLKQAQREVREGSLAMVQDIQRLKGAISAIANDPSGRIGKAVFADAGMQESTRALADHGRRLKEVAALEGEFSRAVKNRETIIASAAREEQRITREAARMDREMAQQRAADVRAMENEFRGSMRARDRGFSGEQAAANAPGMLSRTANAVGLWAPLAAIYGVKRFAESSVERQVDLSRQGEQIGFGLGGTKRLEQAAAQTNTPMELMLNGIVRMQRQVEEMKPKTEEAFKKLGMNALEFATQMETGPEAATVRLIERLHEMSNIPLRNEIYSQFFGARTTRDMAALDQLGTAQVAHGGGEAQIANVLKARGFFESMKRHIQDDFAVGAGELIRRGRKFFGDTSPEVQTPFAEPEEAIEPSGEAAARVKERMEKEKKKAALTERRERRQYESALDTFAPEGLRNMNALARDYREGLDFIDEHGGSASDKERLTSGYNARVSEEQQQAAETRRKKQHDDLTKTKQLLNEFGADGKRNAQLVKEDWEELAAAFTKGKVSLEEFKTAQADYFDMLDQRREGGTLKAAIRQFEEGGLSEDELLQAREIYKARAGRGDVESSFMRGEATPADLLKGQQHYRDTLDLYRPETRIPPMQAPQASSGGGTVNIITMDQFSDSVLRRWQQQGMTFG